MSLLSRAVAKIKDALVFLSQKAAGIGQENQIMEVIHDQVGAGMCTQSVSRLLTADNRPNLSVRSDARLQRDRRQWRRLRAGLCRRPTDTRSELGVRFDNQMLLYPGAVLALRARLAWAHDWATDPVLGAVFQTLPGASSSSTARRRHRTPRWHRRAPSCGWPTASHCSASSTASSPRTQPPTAAPGCSATAACLRGV